MDTIGHQAFEHDPAHLDELARTTMRAVAKFLTRGESDHGNWRVEYDLRDGDVTGVFTHHGPTGRDDLAEAATSKAEATGAELGRS